MAALSLSPACRAQLLHQDDRVQRSCLLNERGWLLFTQTALGTKLAICDVTGRAGMGPAWLSRGCALQGVVIAGSDVVMEVRPCQGLTRGLDGTLEKRFAKKAEPYPLQVSPASAICYGYSACCELACVARGTGRRDVWLYPGALPAADGRLDMLVRAVVQRPCLLGHLWVGTAPAR